MGYDVNLSQLSALADNPRTGESIRATWKEFLLWLKLGTEIDTSNGLVDPKHLARIYRIRLAHLREKGWDTPGFEESIEALSREHSFVIIVGIETDDYHAVCFLPEALDRMVGCLYLRKGDIIAGDLAEIHPKRR
jgi:hypothetical protein